MELAETQKMGWTVITILGLILIGFILTGFVFGLLTLGKKKKGTGTTA
jgi:hypothetical protein